MDDRRILVLNEDAVTADLVTQILEGTGYAATFVTSKIDFETAFSVGAACVVLALCMPDFDGFEAVKFLSENDYQGPVVLLSLALIEMRDIVEKYAKIRGLDVAGSFQRPVDREILEVTILNAIGAPRN